MKSDSQLLNSIAGDTKQIHYLTDEESILLKHMLLLMLKDIAKVCEDNNLVYMLAGGSCLGAIRHSGFIPWDDDLDIIMPRDSYDSFVSLLQRGALGIDYEINLPAYKNDSKTPYLKVYRKGTLDDELYNENTPFPKGIFIDVFPMANVPSCKFHQRLRSFVSDGLLFVSTCVLYSQYPSPLFAEYVKQSSEAYNRYRFRLLLGKLFGIIPHWRWVYWFDKFNSSVKPTGYLTVPNGRKHYLGEILPASSFIPVSFSLFEGVRVPIPNNYDLYLRNLYGDYLRIPPEEKRERHFVYRFKC